jgi:transcriptional regulator
MYMPAHFEETRPEVLHALLRDHPLATWVVQSGGGLLVNHIPFLLDASRGPHGTLIGHVARANPVWREAAGTEVLAVFQGPQAYVTPSWYPSKAETAKVVPTWNYAVVHAQGVVELWHDSEHKEQVLKALIDRHDPAYRSQWDELDSAFREGMKGGIVAFTIAIERIEAKFKLSQNRPEADRARVLEAMQAGGDKGQALARWTAKITGGGD